MPAIKVLIVDDSAVMRLRIKRVLEMDPRITVVDAVGTGVEAVDRVERLKPHVVTMDVQMPEMDGLQALQQIMKRSPVPVVMLSSLTGKGTVETIKALELGAVDFIQKPSPARSSLQVSFDKEILEKVRTAAGSSVHQLDALSPTIKKPKELANRNQSIDLVAIGCSTGGPAALRQIIPILPHDFPVPIVVVQHISPGFTKPLAERLDKISRVKVLEAADGMALAGGHVYIAPAGHVFTLQRSAGRVLVCLDARETASRFLPSVDDMMLSVAEVFGHRALGVILTGMGNDGTLGLAALKKQQGKTLAEAESTCVVFGMPRAAIEAGVIDEVAPVGLIAEIIYRKIWDEV